MKGKAIIAEAKKKLVDFLVFEAPLLYKKLGRAYEPEKEESYILNTDDLEPIYINAETNDTYLDAEDGYYETVEINEVVVSPDGEVWATDKDGREWTSDEISVVELANIADVFERAYNRK